MTNGTSFSADKVSQSISNLVYFSGSNYASSINSSKYLDVSYIPPTSQVETSGTLNGYVLIDDSYDYAQKPATVSTSTLINTTGADATYLKDIKYMIYATVCFTEKEKDDGYQYIQIIADNGSASYDTGYDPEGSVNDPVNSVYKTCFELSDGSNAEGKQYFPHRYNYANKTAETNAGIDITEFSQTNGKLWQQKFKSGYQALNSGSLIFDANTSYITTRFDAGGKDNDTWGYKDLFVRMAFVDASAPTKSAVSVNPGRHAKGNTVYVSVAFSEIVTVTGTPTLSTTNANHWGSLSYVAGSGTNVLTFSTTIPKDATGSLNVTGLSGTVKDLAGNSFNGSVTTSNLCSLDADLAYAIGDFQQEGGNYLITCRDDLRGLASYVNAGNNCSGLTFRQVTNLTFPYTTNWNSSSSTENNFTRIGNSDNPFQGTYDGQGHTISGIRIYKGGESTYSDGFQGLFGRIYDGGTVRNVHLTDTRITGMGSVGGIVGSTTLSCTVEDCTVGADVCIHAVQPSSSFHGGVVGYNRGTVRSSISCAILTASNVTDCANYGGIAGYSTNAIIDCLAIGVNIPDVEDRGAIVGETTKSLTRNYYRACTVAGVANATGVGKGNGGSSTATSDVSGAQPLYAVTLPAHASLVRSGTNLPGTGYAVYDNGADIAGVPYAKASSALSLSYDSAAIAPERDVIITATETSSGDPVAVTDNGDHTYTIASMPAADITVTVTEVPLISYIDADGNEQTCLNPTPIESSNFSKTLGAADATNWYYVSGNVSTKKLLFKDATTNIILCDGATLAISVNNSNTEDAIESDGSINIFAQSGGSGAITVPTACSDGIHAHYSIAINGGTITVGSASDIGFSASNGDVTIRRGCVDVYGSSRGISGRFGVTILGGIVNAASASGSGRYGISSGQGYILTLGCSSPGDRITASSYYYTTYTQIRVANGQTLTDGTDPYTGALNDDQKAAIAGKTLQPAAALAMNGAGIMTYASPFALDLSNVDAYVISDYNNGNSTLTLTKVDEAPANTGLLLKAKNDEQKNTTIALPLQENAAAVGTNLLVGVLSSETVVPQTDGPNTNFILANGKYGIDWYTLSADGAIGANKAYLQLPTAQISGAREFTWVYDSGEATSVHSSQFIVHSEADAWYDLNGRKLSGKPTQKGIYINNGKKVVVK